MRVPRVQVWIFQQAQAPALGGLWSAATAQPVAAVVGIAAQVFPRQRRAVEVQRVEIGGGGIPVLGARFGHDATSCVAGTSPRIPRCESRSEEHTSELQSLMRSSYAVFCLKNKTTVHTKSETKPDTIPEHNRMTHATAITTT